MKLSFGKVSQVLMGVLLMGCIPCCGHHGCRGHGCHDSACYHCDAHVAHCSCCGRPYEVNESYTNSKVCPDCYYAECNDSCDGCHSSHSHDCYCD